MRIQDSRNSSIPCENKAKNSWIETGKSINFTLPASAPPQSWHSSALGENILTSEFCLREWAERKQKSRECIQHSRFLKATQRTGFCLASFRILMEQADLEAWRPLRTRKSVSGLLLVQRTDSTSDRGQCSLTASPLWGWRKVKNASGILDSQGAAWMNRVQVGLNIL